MKTFSSILFATDFSEHSNHAFTYAHAMARDCKGKLVIVHVINEPLDLRGFYVPHISFDNLEQEIREGAEKMMADFCETHVKGIKDVETVIIPGIPYEEIIATAEEKKADLIVLGTHGRSGLDHVLFGSTAEKVVRKSPVPVLTVRLNE